MGKWADRAVSGLIDLIMGIPHMLLLILISYACGKGFTGAAAGIALTHWPSLARVIRAEALQIRESQYVKISARLGMSRLQIIRKHIAPQLLSQFMTGLILTSPLPSSTSQHYLPGLDCPGGAVGGNDFIGEHEISDHWKMVGWPSFRAWPDRNSSAV